MLTKAQVESLLDVIKECERDTIDMTGVGTVGRLCQQLIEWAGLMQNAVDETCPEGYCLDCETDLCCFDHKPQCIIGHLEAALEQWYHGNEAALAKWKGE